MNERRPEEIVEALPAHKYLTLTQAAKLLPTGSGRPPSLPTMHRWVFKGCDGILLGHLRFGRRLYTTIEALEQFGRALAALDRQRLDEEAKLSAAPPLHQRARRQSSRQREKSILAAEARLRDRRFVKLEGDKA